MLKPLKDLLTYLQRNANSSNIFGLTTQATTTIMGPNENPRIDEAMIENDELAIEDGDPLNDPLALDDYSGTELNVSSASLTSEDDDGLSSGKIILVDVTTLKPKEHQDEIETDDVEELIPRVQIQAVDLENEEEPSADLSNGSVEVIELEEVEEDGTGESSADKIVTQTDAESVRSNNCSKLNSYTIVTNGVRVASPLPDDDVEEGALGEKNVLVENFTDDVSQPRPVERTAEQMQTANEGEEEEEASDGSDSGLGLEPSRSVAPCGTSTTSSGSNSSSNSPLQRPPIKSSLKRRSEPLDTSASVQQENEDGVSSQKRPKKGITFEGVTVYYFPRIQGFGCVPSQGGCTLGMEFQHVHSRRLTLSEHSAEQRKVHRQQNQELNPRSSSSEDTSSEEEPSESGSEAESESYGFLQPVSTRQRRALLKAAGVRKIDPTEKDDCREIRTSREVCGCTCRGYCDPSRCACSLAGIKCQVDRPNFPCGCTLEGCANTAGRVEFNPGRVRTHFLHTIMKLRMEGDDGKALEAGSGGALMPRTSSNATASDTNDSGYVIGSEKNWSNGPVRLPPSMVGTYATGIHPGPSTTSNEMVDGIGSMHPVPSMVHHHSHLAHHQPLMDGLHLQPSHLHHLSHQASPYVNHHGTDPSLQNYLVASSSNASHLHGGSVVPSAVSASDPTQDLHYPFRDYYGGLEGAASGGESTHPPGMPLHQLPSCANATEPPSSLHADMYYRGNYSSFVDGRASTTANLDAYRQESMVPLHIPNTGHDRLLPGASNSFASHPDQHTTPGNLPSLRPQEPDCANEPCVSSVPKVPQPVVSSKESTTTTAIVSLSNAPAQDAMIQSFSSVPLTVSTTESCDLNVTVISDNSLSPNELDTSGEVTFVECDDRPRNGSVIIDDEDDDVEEVSFSRRKDRNKNNSRVSSFIDLTAPQADNTGRLEAINDLLENSRNALSIVRRSIIAEEDDELRDFQHPPVEPPIAIIHVDDDDDDVDETQDCILSSALLPERSRRYGDGGQTLVQSPAILARPVTNGTIGNGHERQQQKRKRCSISIGEESDASFRKMLQNGSAAPLVTEELVPTVSSSSGLMSASVNSSGAVATLEPTENLCEIIKNSIVETAVSH
ncbi:uncharacterized protein LOC126563951 [Anopheles maculipalpis]|uniref:uncharacterized protein LOC126563951 n=1 Tax=Anopheles maculipalpis TaxID=1496333 RepID=UPI002158EFA8|nr:uncharacterized protein LOC126563951 [Anopheles maculipalpis]